MAPRLFITERYVSKAIFPSTTTTPRFRSRSSSRSKKGRQLRNSTGSGLFPGGAQWIAAVIHASCNWRPSFALWLCGCEENPALYNERYRKSPERSPVNIRPVRLAPCAPGARPRINRRAEGSPNDGTGFPQYSHSRNARRFVAATSRQYRTRRGQRRQLTISPFNVVKCCLSRSVISNGRGTEFSPEKGFRKK